MKKLDDATKDARSGVFFVCKEVSLNDEKTEDICG